MIVNYSRNYQHAESNDCSEHPESVVTSVQQIWIELCNEEHNWLRNVFMTAFSIEMFGQLVINYYCSNQNKF